MAEFVSFTHWRSGPEILGRIRAMMDPFFTTSQPGQKAAERGKKVGAFEEKRF